MQAVTLPALALFYNLPVGRSLLASPDHAVGDDRHRRRGHAVQRDGREHAAWPSCLLPMLSLPFFVPVLLNAAQATTRVLAGRPARRGVAVVEDPHRVRHRVRRRVHAGFSLYARRMTAAPTVARSPAASRSATQGRYSIGCSRSRRLAWSRIYIRAIYFTPIEAMQGAAQKIYYLHVPAALAAYIAVSITALTSIVYLWLHDERADRLAEASAEVGLVFLTVVLTTGPLWGAQHLGRVVGVVGHAADAHAVSVVRRRRVSRAARRHRGRRDARRAISAVLGVLGALLIPFIHLSVYLFQARLHPMPVVLKPSEPSMPPEMLRTFLSRSLVFAVLCLAFIRARYRFGVAARSRRGARTRDRVDG